MTLLDQAAELRQIARRVNHRAQTIAITSGKGGVGKTNLAVNLATVLATAQRRVVLMDADMGLANADILCNIQPRYNLAHVVAGQRRMPEVLTPTPNGFSLVAGASGLTRMAELSEQDRARILQELETLQDAADVIIIDTGAGISRNVMAFTAAADHVVVVTTPEPTAITDAYAVLKVLIRSGSKAHLSLMVNQVRNRDEARAVHDRISSVARQFLQAELAFSGYVVADPCVSQSVRKRAAFVKEFPKSAACQCVEAWANRLAQHVDVARVAQRPTGGFFNRLASWWR